MPKDKTSLDTILDESNSLTNHIDVTDHIENIRIREKLAELGDTPGRITNGDLINHVVNRIKAGDLNYSNGRLITSRNSYTTVGLSIELDVTETSKPTVIHTGGAVSVPASNPATTPPPPVAPAPAVAPKEEVCIASALTVKCGHEKRTVTLSLPGKDGNTISIVSGRDKKIDKLTAELTMDKPLCGKHEGKAFTVSPAARSIDQNGSKADIELQCEPWRDKPFSHIWLPKLKPINYTINPGLCKSFPDSSVSVKVYPDIKWSWDVGVNLGGAVSDSKEHSADYGVREHKLKQRKWAVSGTVECSYDGTTHKLNPQFEKYVDTTLESVNAARNVFESVLPKLKNQYTRTFEVTWPDLHLKYTSTFEEQKDAFDVDHVYSFVFGANPIIEIKYEADILEILLGLAKANPSTKLLADVLFAVKQQMREGMGDQKSGKFYLKGDVAILASIAAKTSGEVTIKGRADKIEEGEGEIKIEIPLKIEGHAYIEGAFFYVKFKKGYKIGARSGFGGRVALGADQKGIYDYGGLFFTGVYLYYVRYEDARGSVKSASKYKGGDLSSSPSGVHEASEELEWIGPMPKEEDMVDKRRYLTKNN